jgi:hypothetical protein
MGTFLDDQGNIHMDADLANPNSHNRLSAGLADSMALNKAIYCAVLLALLALIAFYYSHVSTHVKDHWLSSIQRDIGFDPHNSTI